MSEDGIDWTRWPRTRQAIAASEPEAYDLDDKDDAPERGHRLLRAMAEDSGGAMRQVEPGRWYVSKLGGEPPVGGQTGTE
ncbi:hypothetical protein JIG36_32150 [Actinoplanes sp. LDG1-06]|uniref:Uncharacterized protein n=1 Tax=Paractinoplanes ovalisporus TaxID=2810368 RepID=A0ABS2AK01_9ACTN|nr:hypothetical protein [Actinoplanes ovalisporus]MBM2620177.1 hypothetical protein [Actinoplanes ovalisporus]